MGDTSQTIEPDTVHETISGTLTDTQDVEASSSTIPSSPLPKDAPIFSDNALPDTDSDLSSPPSSPPPCLPAPILPTYKSAFSFLKRKRSVPNEPGPMADIDHNVRRIQKAAKHGSLKQMQIDLGGETRRTCEDCGMEYFPSVSEDSALHKDFHNMNKKGINVGNTFMKDAGTRSVLPGGERLPEDEAILMIDRRSSLASRNKVKKILGVVNSELSATEIEDKYLWGVLASTSRPPSTRKTSADGSNEGSARFKAFAYLVGDKCIGFCLIEKVSSACQVIDRSKAENEGTCNITQIDSSSILTSDKKDVVLLGVSRIWTSRSRRRQGVALTLLECARKHFFFGMEVTKDLVAFSQPTDSGARLARQWFGSSAGWHVYGSEDC